VSAVWDRLTPAARRALSLASEESEQLGHGYIGDEHVLLGLLGEQASQASSLLRAHGLDLPGARAELQRMVTAGLTPRSHADDGRALRSVGIDVETVRRRLVTAFGAEAVGEAVWRASRRPWWRGGGRRRTPLCGPPFFAKRALQLAACHAESRGEAAVTPEHLLHGVLRDLDDPYGAQLGRRGRKHLTQLGWTIGDVNPAAALLQAHRIDPARLRAELDSTP
jgi:ATP-dependent Clp protease ATP-binding subunit ClpA